MTADDSSSGDSSDDSSSSTDTTLAGALFHIETFNAESGFNNEVVVIPYGDSSYIGITSQSNAVGDTGGTTAAVQADDGDTGGDTGGEAPDTGETSEWWIAQDAYALTWERSDKNPLEQYGCQQVGRHSVLKYNGEIYFGAQCSYGSEIFKIVALDGAELVHDNSLGAITQPEQSVAADDSQNTNAATQYPTAVVMHDAAYFFFNGGYTKFDGTTWEDDANVPEGEDGQVPLQITDPNSAGNVYLPLFNRVFEFDGDTYTEIGTLPDDVGNLLAAVALFNGSVLVGNSGNPAHIYQYNFTKDNPAWQTVVELPDKDQIVNKMVVTNTFNETNYLVYFTKNKDYGAKMYALGEDGVAQVLTKLSGDHPEYNEDIVSFVNQTVKTDDNPEAEVILFGTQNNQTEAELYGLQVGTDLAVIPTEDSIVSTPSDSTTETSAVAQAILNLTGKNTNLTAHGSVFKLKVAKSQVQAGDVFTLYVNGKVVDRIKAKSNDTAVILKYKKAKNMASGQSFTVQVGRKLSYGKGSEKIIASNVVTGDTLKITVE